MSDIRFMEARKSSMGVNLMMGRSTHVRQASATPGHKWKGCLCKRTECGVDRIASFSRHIKAIT